MHARALARENELRQNSYWEVGRVCASCVKVAKREIVTSVSAWKNYMNSVSLSLALHLEFISVSDSRLSLSNRFR